MKNFKKLFIFMFLLVNIVLSFTILKADNDDMLYIHYYRYDQDYTSWNAWIWQYKPTGKDGSAYNFTDDDTAVEYNFGGKVIKIDLNEKFPDAIELGIIVRKGNWEQKDVEEDRHIDISKGDRHFYFVEGDPLIGTSLNDPNGPSRYHKYKIAQFVDDKEIYLEATTDIDTDSLKLYKNGLEVSEIIDNVTLQTDKSKGKIILKENLNYQSVYEIETDFGDHVVNSRSFVDFSGMFDKESFNNAFYTDEELGAIYTKTATTFKVWAPLASNVTLNIYQTGTPSQFGGNDDKVTHILDKGNYGVYQITLDGDYHGKYYTFDVTNGNTTGKDIVDPYAKSVGINGLRGLVVDFSQTNPLGWESFNRPKNVEKKVDSIIYELHVRDLTTHSTWSGTEENRGMFLGLIESGTTHLGLTTGFDHIKGLGITHLQILPFFDYGNAIDESRQHDEDYNSFNWGYMPLNFNALEGNYSKDPHDGLLRINEFKQVVMAYGNEGIRINMDVVYNHTGQSADSNFHLIVPGYYHRFTSNGAFSNGSGTGNETASERKMVSKFIVDSVLFWADTYKLGGFRFDLMALHDIDTMNELSDLLHQRDPDVLVYGEPWMGGSTPLSASLQAGKENLHQLNNIGAFNDDTRDAIKGSVFSTWMKGFIQGDYAGKHKVKYGIVGGIEHPAIPNYNVWHTSPDKTINYVTAHDNNTLHDKLYMSLEGEDRLHLIEKMSLQAHGIILTSQGISFIHAGDEFLRSKETGSGFDANSYQSPDSVNQIRWDLKGEYYDHYNYFKMLLDIRNNNKVFKKGDNNKIKEEVKFIFDDKEGVLSYILYDDGDTYVVIVNASDTTYYLDMKNHVFELLIDTDVYYINRSNKFSKRVSKNSFIILKTGEEVSAESFSLTTQKPRGFIDPNKGPKMNLWPIILISIGGAVIGAGVGLGVYFIFRKKQQ